MGGKKMSKSLGNIIPLRDAVREYSADAIRLAMLVSAELLQDADFSIETAKGIRSKLNALYHMAIEYSNPLLSQMKQETIHEELEDRWLFRRLRQTIEDTTKSMDRLRVRDAVHNILYSMDHDLRWYEKRVKAKKREDLSVHYARSTFLDARIRMLAPFAPFISEEIWELTRKSTSSIVFCQWPTVYDTKEDVIAEESEQLIKRLIIDIQKIVKVAKIRPKGITFYTAGRWKFKIYSKILSSLSESSISFGDIVKILLRDPETAEVKNNLSMVRKMVEDILSEPIETRNRRLGVRLFDEKTPIEDAESLIRLETDTLDAKISVHSEDNSDLSNYDPKLRAKSARPFKPAIYLTQ
jgi:leucyl-tRNA synthetase